MNQRYMYCGGSVGDFNSDGRDDIYVTSGGDMTDVDRVGQHMLYRNNGDGTFTDGTVASGTGLESNGMGGAVGGFNRDGLPDGYVTSIYNDTTLQDRNYLYVNQGNHTYTAIPEADGAKDGGWGWDEPVALFRNDVSGPDTHSIEIALDTSGSSLLPPQGYGAKITATAGGVSQYAWPNGGSTYLGRSQMVTHFGLGAETSVDLTVQWSNGLLTTATGVAADQIVTLGPPVAGAPGEASGGGAGGAGLMKAHLNRTTGLIEVEYTPSCNASNHTIYYGDLANVSTYGYTGAACWRGNSGLTSFDPSGLTSAFFLIVGNTGLLEGSYGTDRFSTERPNYTAGACPLPQDLSAGCGLP